MTPVTSPASAPSDAPLGAPPPGESAALRLDGIVKRFGPVMAVAGVSLSVREGEFLTVLGPSGSGKTTLLRLVAGFAVPTSGEIYLQGRPVSRIPPAKRGIGMVFQNYALFPHLTALDNVAYGLKVRKWKKERRHRRAAEVLALVGLAGMERRLPAELSGGQQQRVALARALAFEPTLLLMDEPLGALDRELRIHMAGELRRLHHELGTTAVYVTHDREEALTLSDRIAVMRDGTVESLGTPQALYGHPDTRFVASFFGGHNVLPCRLEELAAGPGPPRATVTCLGQRLTVAASPQLDAAGREAWLAVPGDGFSIADPGAAGARLHGRVDSAVYMGSHIQVTCTLGGAEGGERHGVRLDLPGGGALPPGVGTAVGLSIRPERATAVPG